MSRFKKWFWGLCRHASALLDKLEADAWQRLRSIDYEGDPDL